MAKIELQITRSLLFAKAGSVGVDPTDEEESDFLSLDFGAWAANLWVHIHDHRKREWHLANMPSVSDEIVDDVQLVFVSFEDFKHKLLMCVYPDADMMSFLSNCMFMLDSVHTGPVKAQQLDSYYARLVKGAMVNAHISVVWSPSDETEHSDKDNQRFSDVMWKTLVKVMDTESIRKSATDAEMLKRTVLRIKHIKSAMKVRC